MTRFVEFPGAFPLEGGATLDGVRVAYRTWGRLAPDRGNAVLVCHALTGSADVDLWWGGLLGPGRALDPAHDFVICSNVLGSCYGTTGPKDFILRGPQDFALRGPRDLVPRGPQLHDRTFPDVTVRDMVRLQARLLDELGIERLGLVVGGSLGGLQALEWAATFPNRVESIAAIAASGRHSPWCIALSETQRLAVALDPVRGLAVARAIAMCSYRSPASFAARFGREERAPGLFEVESWLHHHGAEICRRFDPASYVTLTRAMDTHDLARGRGPYEHVLRAIDVPALIVAIDSDVLYRPAEQEELASLLPRSALARLDSPHGHDAFLIDAAATGRLIAEFRFRRFHEHRRRHVSQA